MASFLRSKKNRPANVAFECEGVDLLPGEIIVARATNTHMIVTLQEKTSLAVGGVLVSTNYRVTFVPDKELLVKMGQIDPGYFASSRDVPLGCVDRITVFANKSKKVLDGLTTLPKKISQIEITCKDVRKLLFSVKQCERHDVSSLVSAIARHSHPGNVNLLFAFDFTRALKRSKGRESTPPSGSADSSISTFLTARDWQRELQRLGVTNDQWRVTEINKKFLVCNSLCPYFACPTNYSDSALENAAGLHLNNRLPVWCWSHPHTGVSLTRAAVTSIEDSSEAPDPVYLRSVALARHKQYQANNKRVYQYNVTVKCGTVKDLSTGFSRLQELCAPGSDVSGQDRHWLSGLESSGWLAAVRNCLLASKEISNLVCIKQRCVMILDETGRDYSCVVSSLVQMMIDPYFRSISGFEMLVQKEWVAMGHPFMTRYRLTVEAPVVSNNEEQVETGAGVNAPVFLVFLDCVWQLSKQFPSAFEFSENFLIRFYDMTLQCLYNNFLFDSPKQRLQATIESRASCFFGDEDEPMDPTDSNYEGPLLSAWSHWRSQHSVEENEECLNPLYYIFGSSDAHYDYNSANPLETQVSPVNSLLPEKPVDLATAGNHGLYRGSRETSPADLALDSKMRDYYQRGLLMPETSMCGMQIWSGFFFRYAPELNSREKATQTTIQKLESRMVRDVRKMKDELNEVELTVGSYTSDLTSFIGEVLQTREKELQQDKEIAVDQSLTAQPRLSAVVYSYEGTDNVVEIDTNALAESLSQDQLVENGDLSQSSLLSRPSFTLSLSQKTSLAEFTDALYSSEMEEEVKSYRSKHLLPRTASPTSSPVPPGRSPVTKTRLKVTRSKASDPVIAAWQHSPQQMPKTPEEKILIQKDSNHDFSAHSFEFSDV